MTDLGRICDMDTIIVSDGVLKLNPANFVDGTTITFDGKLHRVNTFTGEYAAYANTVEKNGKLYKVLTVWGESGLADGCEWLGLSNAEWFATGVDGTRTITTYEELQYDDTDGNRQWVQGSITYVTVYRQDFNAYARNNYHNLWAANERINGREAQTSEWYATNFQQNTWSTDTGVYMPLKYRPEIVFANEGQTNDINDGVSRIQKEQYTETKDGGSFYDYVPNDSSYDPQVTFNYYNDQFSYFNALINVANFAQKIIDESANNSGLVEDDPLTWRSAQLLPVSNRRDESPLTLALAAEALIKGAVAFIRKKISMDGWDTKKVAFVTSDPNGLNVNTVYPQYATSVIDPFGIAPLVCEMYPSGGTASIEIDPITGVTNMRYAGTLDADNLAGCDCVIADRDTTFNQTDWQDWIYRYATTQDLKNRAAQIDYLTSFPLRLSGVFNSFGHSSINQFYNGLFALEFCYHDMIYDSTNNIMSFSCLLWDYLNNLGDRLSALMNAIYAGASFSTGVILSDIPNGYSRRSTVDALYEGLNYYYTNHSIDALYSRLESNKDIAGNTSASGISYNFSSIAPTSELSAYLNNRSAFRGLFGV